MKLKLRLVHRFPELCAALGLAVLGGCSSSSETSAPGPVGNEQTPVLVPDHGDRGPLVVVPPAPPPLPAQGPPLPPTQNWGSAEPTSAPVAPPALSGGTLLALRDGRTAVVSDPDSDHLFVVDVVNEKVVADLALTAGDQPGRAAEDETGRLHVVLRRGGALISFNPAQPAVIERRAVCAAPRGVAYQPSTKQVHVACAGGELVSLPAAGGAIARSLSMADDLRDVVVDGQRLLLTRFRSAELLVVDAAGQVQERVRPVEGLNLFHRNVPQPARARFVPAVAWRAIARPGGGVFMAHQRAFTGEIDPHARNGYGAGGCTSIVQSVVSELVPGQPSPPPDHAPPAIAMAVLPVDLAVAADGLNVLLLVAGPPRDFGETSLLYSQPMDRLVRFNRDQVSCIHPYDGITTQPPSDRWQGSGTGAIGGQGVAIAVDGRGEVLVQTRAPATLRVPRQGKIIALGAAGDRDSGHTLFHAPTQGEIACASCHPEGGDDGHVWNFKGLGPRRSQSLLGGLAQTAPFHWDGTLTTLDALMKEVFSTRMSGGLLFEPQVAALASWLDRLPAPPSRRAPQDAAAARGKTLFESAAVGCAVCHAGPGLTDNRSHEVGRGPALQTPSLRGVAWRPPFMHDGCAPSLRGRFVAGCGGDDRHGVTSRLTEAQLLDLVAYLETL